MTKPGETKYTPTPKEIRLKCEEIQAGWTPAEVRKRSVSPPEEYTIPRISSFGRFDFTGLADE